MKHCMFENTLLDLKDAYHRLHDVGFKGLSPAEHNHAKALVALCDEIVQDFGVNIFSDGEKR